MRCPQAHRTARQAGCGCDRRRQAGAAHTRVCCSFIDQVIALPGRMAQHKIDTPEDLRRMASLEPNTGHCGGFDRASRRGKSALGLGLNPAQGKLNRLFCMYFCGVIEVYRRIRGLYQQPDLSTPQNYSLGTSVSQCCHHLQIGGF